MKELIVNILTLSGFFLAGVLFVYLRGKIFNRAKSKVKEIAKTNIVGLNASVGKKYKKNGKEPFSFKKFIGGFAVIFSGADWGKDIVSIFNLRKLTIYGIIIGVIFAYGFWKGQQGKQINVNLGYEEAVEIQVPNSDLRLYKPTNSNKLYWVDKEGNKIPITVADIPALKKALKPIAFEFKPVGILGAGSGLKNVGVEGGVGFSFLRYWRWHLESYLTNYGVYLGTSYKLELGGLKNSSVGIGIGKGYVGDDRAMIYYKWEF